MTPQPQAIVAALGDLWTLPAARRTAQDLLTPGRLRDIDLSAHDAFAALRQRFETPAIAHAVRSFIGSVAASYETCREPDRDEIFLCACCMDLAAEIKEVTLDEPTLQRVVCSFPATGWYARVMKLMQRAQWELGTCLGVVSERLGRPAPPCLVWSCLDAIEVYGRLMPRAPVEDATVQSLGVRIAALQNVSDPKIRRAARLAEGVRRSLPRV